MTSLRREGVSILGVRVDPVRPEQAVALVDAYIRGGGTHHIVTVNPEFVVQARGDQDFRQVLNGADLAIADGVGLLLAARVLGRPLPGRVTGVELVERTAALAAEQGYTVYLLGAADGVAEAAAAVLRRRHPRLQVVGVYAGSPHPSHDLDIIQRVRAANPDILFVAYGAPAQDLWIRRNRAALDVPVAVGVGGTFDYLSGRVPRAPGLVRRLGFEWLYRLVRQPWRWRRQLRLPLFVLLVLAERVRRAQRG